MDPSVQHLISSRFDGIHHRQLFVISGAEVWCLNQVEQLFNSIPVSVKESISLLTVTLISQQGCIILNQQRAMRHHLGREYDYVVYNAGEPQSQRIGRVIWHRKEMGSCSYYVLRLTHGNTI